MEPSDQRAEPGACVLPETIGPFKILEVLGEGGMGIVYLADQREPVRRRVALKVVKLGLGTKEVLARFEAERQALALMNHPNIAKVLDAGTTPDGRPYFAMEHVPGISITQYCDKQKLGLEERLRLFADTCRGIQHAHQKGIVHRDVKPSNILVHVQDGRPTPKIIDFGIAKALDQRLTERTLFTEQGRIVGTPEYMSPEQAEMSGLEVDTRTDVYSLGVVLYELLVGALPFEPRKLREAGYLELQRQIREVDPPKPSTRISTLGDAASARAMHRRLDAATLMRRLRGELDWVTMKALEKDPTRRYQSASEFSADVERFLTNEPVAAGPPSARYRLTKFARRHRGLLAAIASVLLTLVVGIIGMGVFAVRASHKETEARANEAEANRLAILAQDNANVAAKARASAEASLLEARYQTYVANLSACGSNLDDKNYPEAWRRLMACPEEYRHNWEWRLLRLQCDYSQQIGVLAGGITALRFGPRGDKMFFATNNGDVWVRKNDLEPVLLLAGGAGIDSMSLDERGTVLATCHLDGAVRIWNPETGESRGAARGEGRGFGVGLAGDGTRVVAGCGTEVRVWDTATMQQIALFPGHGREAGHVAISRDGTRVWSADYDGWVRVFDVATGSKLGEVSLAKPISCSTALALNHRQDLLAYGNANGEVVLLDATDLTVRSRRRGHDETVTAVTFTPDDHKVFSASRDATVRSWDAAHLDQLTIVRGSRYMLTAIDVAPDGLRVAAGEFGPTWRVWETMAEQPVVAYEVVAPGNDEQLEWGTMNSAGSRFAVSTSRGNVRVYDGRSGTLTWEADDAATSVRCLAWDPGGALLLAGDDHGFVRCYDVERQVRLWETKTHPRVVASLVFRRDGTQCFAGTWDRSIATLDVTTGVIRGRIATGAEVNSLQTTPDDRWLLAGLNDFTVHLFDLTDPTKSRRFQDNGHVDESTFSPDGSVFCTATSDGTVKIWEQQSGSVRATFRGHKGSVRCVAWSPDGGRIFSGADDATIRVWDVSRQELLTTLRGHQRGIVHIDVCANGERVFSASRDGTVRIWDTARARVQELWRRRSVERVAELRAAESLRNHGSAVDATADIRTRADLTDEVRSAALQLMAHRQSAAVRIAAENLARNLMRKHLLVDAALAELSADAGLDAGLREAAAACVRQLGDAQSRALNNAAWELVKGRDRPVADYSRAEQLARAACIASPADPYPANTLGVALYRLGRFADAGDTLRHADQLNRAAGRIYPPANDAVFTAMCVYQQGDKEQARGLLQPLRQEIPKLGDAELEAFLVEAVALIDGR